ncbi:TonB-dependent receptor [Tsuneonella sp. CC-YZS046]|uniref:TonB-dependent receptor n=1 Tax=Tsuneonella sp. CC-YZS046 TaxID=3042152 RepID=UPI002D7806F1|nr:TonB-dependent receptor [Tsuneonella sp. CC-YZS046]WRO67225.1 TonB-dependent receptor [Tsuneonella sp. CC-YZS046]
MSLGKKMILGLGTSAMAMGWAAAAHGQETGGLNEIIVTAQKREQSLMDVGQTLSVLSGDALEKQRIQGGEDLAIAVPSLTFARSDYNVPVFSLRGIGFNSSALGAYPAVSFYLDEAPLAFPITASNQTFDLQRIEVLKGPQGTLFGQNSTGGAINLIANKPTDSFEAGVSATYGRFNLFEFTGHVSGPLSDTVRARFAGQAHVMDPWQKSYTRPWDRNGREEYFAGRGILEWEPDDTFKATLTVAGWKDKSEPQALALAGTKYAYTQYLTTPLGAPVLDQPLIPTNPRYADWGGPVGPSDNDFIMQSTPTRLFADRDQIQGSLRLEFSPTDNLLLTSLSSYVRFRQEMGASRSGSAIQNEDQTRMDGRIDSFSQELRLENTGNNALHWVVGVNYENSKIAEDQLQSYANNTSAINSGIFQNGIKKHDSIENIAAFANLEAEIIPRLTAKGGIRYTKSTIKNRACGTDAGDGNIANVFNYLGDLFNGNLNPDGSRINPDLFPYIQPGDCFTHNYALIPGEQFRDTLKEDNVSWRVGLDYRATDELLLYGNVSKGYKTGSFPTGSPASYVGLQPVTQESVLAYEIGLKSELLDRRLTINAAGFIYDYRDKQVQGSINDAVWGALPQLRNIPKSKVKGAEIEINAAPVRGLSLSASATYLDSEITRIDPNEYTAVGPLDMNGQKLPLTPKWSYMLGGEYTFDAGRISPFIGANWRWVGKTDATLGGSITEIPALPAGGPQNRFLPGYDAPFTIGSYGLLSGRAGINGPDDRWSLYVWCDNCTNKYYWLNVTVAQDNISRGVGRPATYGVTATFDF